MGSSLSEAGCRRSEPQTDGTDLVLGLPVSFGMGYALRNEAMNKNIIGSTIVVDQDGFSYVMNQMDNHIVGDPRFLTRYNV